MEARALPSARTGSEMVDQGQSEEGQHGGELTEEETALLVEPEGAAAPTAVDMTLHGTGLVRLSSASMPRRVCCCETRSW